MKYFYLFFLVFTMNSYGQGGINTSAAQPPNAMFEIRATDAAAPLNTDGLIIPKIDAFPLTNPTSLQNSMLSFLTTPTSGYLAAFHYWDDSLLA